MMIAEEDCRGGMRLGRGNTLKSLRFGSPALAEVLKLGRVEICFAGSRSEGLL